MVYTVEYYFSIFDKRTNKKELPSSQNLEMIEAENMTRLQELGADEELAHFLALHPEQYFFSLLQYIKENSEK